MHRFLCLLIAAIAVGSLRAESPPTVAELVKQLGDAQFAKREVAQRELLKRGEGIVPELDRLSKGVDAETAERLRKIRYELVGYLDDIKQMLPRFDPILDSVHRQISSELRDLITGHQPRAGDFLLECVADSKHRLHSSARRAFVQTWTSATASHLDKFIQLQVYLWTEHRQKFPAKVGAMIPMGSTTRDGWFEKDGAAEFTFKARTTRDLDGKPYERPYESPYPNATVGWYRVGELAEGKHTIHAVLEYEFTHRGEKRKGEIRSKDSQFEVVSADTPDDLIAPKSVDLFKRVKTALELVRAPPPSEGIVIGLPQLPQAKWEEIPVTWDVSPGKRRGLSCPRWDIKTPLDVDLCFEVEIHDVKTGKVYPADTMILRKGDPGGGWVMPRDVRAFAGDREGLVDIKVVRKPSRAMALTDPNVTSYFPETITTEGLQIKVHKDLPPLPLTK